VLVTSFDVSDILIDKEKCGNELHVSEGHRELRCTVLSCVCCICNKPECRHTAKSVAVYRPSVPAMPSAVAVTD
jgi:hypothetical protein